MIDRSGHIIHIDFGFMLQNYPGGVNFESVPFKLTQEYLDLMDGPESDKFELFKCLIVRGLIEVRRNLDDLLYFITIMQKGKFKRSLTMRSDSNMPCFKYPETVEAEIRNRLKVANLPDSKRHEMYELTERITFASQVSFFTSQYDNFQKFTNGINI